MTNIALNERKKSDLQKLLKKVSSSKESGFYRKMWTGVYSAKKPPDFDSLPIISVEDIIKCKFDDRIYTKDGLFVKIIYRDNVPFLLARTKKDISKEDYSEIRYERPLVTFESSHESIEKGLWHYGKNILPLMAEDNLTITLITSGRYGIDSIMGDAVSLKKLSQSGSQYFDNTKIKNVTVIDSRFDENPCNFLNGAFVNAQLQLILALPETGTLAKVCKENISGKLVFHPVENTIIEIRNDEKLVVTRLIMLPTPIIRYSTGIKIKMRDKDCSCDSKLSFSLQN